jgi:hypothetical protein
MKRMLLYATVVVLACASLGFVQSQDDTRVNGQQVKLPDGHVQFTVTNKANQPITAIAVVAIKTPLAGGNSGRSVRIFDSVVNPFGPYGRAIMPGGSHTFSLAGPLEKRQIDATLKAVIFADGSSVGDTTWVQRLVHARQLALNYVEDALQFIRSGRTAGTQPSALAEEAQQRSATVLHSSASIDEKQVSEMVYGEVALHLQGGPDGSAPTDQRFDSAISQLLTRRSALLNSKPSLQDKTPGGSGN